ncbi:hypothetical protein ACFLUV_06575 [Elusimicrobiota bacterium]
MNKKRFSLLLVILVACCAAVPAKVDFAPYYNYQFAEGVSISPSGDLGFLVNLSNDIGLILKPFKGHSLISFYSVKYQGPGLKRQEGREFSERYLDHIFVGRHHWEMFGGITLKSQFDVLLEGRRSGSNENWENGLYNFNRYGGSSSLNKMLGEIDFTGTFKYHYMVFPNYTDMLAEIRSGADPSASEGKQNHHIINIGGKVVYENNSAQLFVMEQLYTKQKVAVDEVQDDGTYYSSKKQKDMTISLEGSREQAISDSSIINPGFTFTLKDSNQNYQHFAEATSTAPVSFHSDYNDYMDISVGTPFTLGLSKKWAFLLSPEISYKTYSKREPRDIDGNFIDGKKQARTLTIVTVGFKNQIGESSSSMLFFTLQNQSSNMKFERYLPYNYSGYSVGFKFQMEY